MYKDDIKHKIRRYKKAIRGDESDEDYLEYLFMKELGWGYSELYNLPEHEYQKFLRIWILETKERIKNERFNY